MCMSESQSVSTEQHCNVYSHVSVYMYIYLDRAVMSERNNAHIVSSSPNQILLLYS